MLHSIVVFFAERDDLKWPLATTRDSPQFSELRASTTKKGAEVNNATEASRKDKIKKKLEKLQCFERSEKNNTR